MLRTSTLHNAVGLALFMVVTAGVITVTRVSTLEAIDAQREAARLRELLQILPADAFDNAILEDVVAVDTAALGLREPEQVFIARSGDTVVGALLPLRVPDGYSGEIRMLLGLRPDGSIIGLRVLEHRETPNLGDQIELRKSDWILNFTDISLGDLPTSHWAVRKDGGIFDAFSGATITPRAVIRSVYRALSWFEQEGKIAIFDPRGRRPQQ